ncbi:MAG: two-component system, response regulator YesN [Clostridiales bacterium]|jgi:AraC-like DNA-binding protein|nr:two-component system, response regulator YesN [Clostridiales bacterium]
MSNRKTGYKTSNRNSNVYSAFRQKISFVLLFVFFTANIMAAIIIWQQTYNAKKELMQQSLKQAQMQTDIIYSRINNLGLSILRQQDIASWLYTKEIDASNETSIIRVLETYNAANDDLASSIGVYNSYLEKYLTSRGIMPLTTAGSPVGNEQFSIRPRELSSEYYAQTPSIYNSIRFLSFYTRIDTNPQRTNQGFTVINIEDDIWQSSVNNQVANSQYYLINSEGIVLSSSDDQRYITDLSYDQDFSPLFEAITKERLSGIKQPESLSVEISGHRNLLVWLLSENTGMISIATLPLNIIIQESAIAAIPWFIAFAILASILFILNLRIIRIYSEPLRKMVKYLSPELLSAVSTPSNSNIALEFSLIQSALLEGEKQGQIAAEKHLLDLLYGRTTVDDIEMNHVTAEIRQAPWILIVCRFDNYIHMKNNLENDIKSHRFMIINVTQELVSTNFICRSVLTSENEIAFILSPREQESLFNTQQLDIDDNIRDLLHRAQISLRQYFGFSISYTWSSLITSFDSIPEHFTYCRRNFACRFQLGQSQLISKGYASSFQKKVRYPAIAERHILEAVNLKQTENLNRGLQDFISMVCDGFTPRTEDYIVQLLASVFKAVDHTVELKDSEYEMYVDTTRSVSYYDNRQDLLEMLSVFCTKLMNLSSEKAKDMLLQKHEQLIADLRIYLSENLSDQSLSLESTADYFQMSSGYLGRLFKNGTGDNFSHYLINLRLNEAAKLLVETPLPAKEICERIGMNNVTYFSTLFKKHMGLSPIKYREKITNENHAST